jgi:hypothetical protein
MLSTSISDSVNNGEQDLEELLIDESFMEGYEELTSECPHSDELPSDLPAEPSLKMDAAFSVSSITRDEMVRYVSMLFT